MRVLADGTYLAELRPPRKSDGPVITVRVIEYTVHTAAEDGAGESSEVFALVTSLLDTEEYPALDLACCYPDRWGCETVIGRHKTDMGEGQPVLRSGDPEGVIQEMWALFAVYQAICKLIGIGVSAMGIPSARISFPHALAAATDTVAASPLTSWTSPSPRSCSRSSCPASTSATARTEQPRKTKKCGDFPARQPGEPSVTNVVRRIQLHLLCPWQIIQKQGHWPLRWLAQTEPVLRSASATAAIQKTVAYCTVSSFINFGRKPIRKLLAPLVRRPTPAVLRASCE